MNTKILIGVLLVELGSFHLAAQEDTACDPQINAWVEGDVSAVDPATGRFTIHGSPSQYSETYDQMLQDIHAQTANLTGAYRDAKVTEIRTQWRDRLNAAHQAQNQQASDLSFSMKPDGSLRTFDVRTKESVDATNSSLNDLKVGDHISVGYSRGATNTPYEMLRIPAATDRSIPASFEQRNPSPNNPTPINPGSSSSSEQQKPYVTPDVSKPEPKSDATPDVSKPEAQKPDATPDVNKPESQKPDAYEPQKKQEPAPNQTNGANDAD